MRTMRYTLAITALLWILAGIGGCSNKQKNQPNKNIVWIKNHHASLFRLGTNANDSFIELYSNPKSMELIGRFFWGSSSHVTGYKKLEGRSRIVSLSAIHTGMLAELNHCQSLVGVESQKYISHPALFGTAELIKMIEVAPNGPIIPEKLALLHPNLLIGYVSSVEDKQVIERIGNNKFSILWCNNHLENHPLGRAEWLVAMGWIVGNATKAQETFNFIEQDYLRLKNEVQEKNRNAIPTVMMNCAYNGIWFVPHGQSYMSQFIRDAGGDPLTLHPKGSLSNAINIEQAMGLVKNADVWINTDLCTSLLCLSQSEPRVAHIKAFQNKRVYHFNKAINANGSNPYWDLGCIFPNRLLGDLATILGDSLNKIGSNHQNSKKALSTKKVTTLHYYDICK